VNNLQRLNGIKAKNPKNLAIAYSDDSIWQ
jgi:hypothetical protein